MGRCLKLRPRGVFQNIRINRKRPLRSSSNERRFCNTEIARPHALSFLQKSFRCVKEQGTHPSGVSGQFVAYAPSWNCLRFL